MKILEFLQDNDGRFSSTRLFMLLVALGGMVDWMNAVFTTSDGIWQPEYQTIGLILGVLGFKIVQKRNE